jgi:hypothetical protein
VPRRIALRLLAPTVTALMVALATTPAPPAAAASETLSWPDFRSQFLKQHRHYLPTPVKPPREGVTHAWLRWQARYFAARARAMARIRRAYSRTLKASIPARRLFTSTVPPGAIRTAVLQAFGAEGEHALAVLQCENPGLNAGAIHHNGDGTSDWGLFQINIVYNRGAFDYAEHLLDPWYNISVAAGIYGQRGWGDWTCGRLLGLG